MNLQMNPSDMKIHSISTLVIGMNYMIKEYHLKWTISNNLFPKVIKRIVNLELRICDGEIYLIKPK